MATVVHKTFLSEDVSLSDGVGVVMPVPFKTTAATGILERTIVSGTALGGSFDTATLTFTTLIPAVGTVVYATALFTMGATPDTAITLLPKPAADTVQVLVDGNGISSPGGFTYDAGTGVVTLVAARAQNEVVSVIFPLTWVSGTTIAATGNQSNPTDISAIALGDGTFIVGGTRFTMNAVGNYNVLLDSASSAEALKDDVVTLTLTNVISFTLITGA